MKKEEQTYEQAMAKLEAIVQKMENEETPIDALATNLRQAQELIAFCKARLTIAEQDVEKISREVRC